MAPTVWLLPLLVAIVVQADPKGDARRFLDLCQAGKFAEAGANFNPAMRQALPPEKLAETWKGLVAQLGALKTMGEPRVDRVQASTRVKIRCEYPATVLDVLVSFNNKGQIEGFVMTPAARAADAPGPPYVDASRFTEEAITVGARDWPLPGTLTRPKGIAMAPLVVLVHGSGPNDRDESIGPNTPFRDIAHGLASRGIAVLRYDKRTHAHKERMVKEPATAATVTIEEEVIQDVLATLSQARKLSGIDARQIFVLGHSAGGSLAPLIARRDGQLAGIILLAASNRPPEQLLHDQLTYIQSIDPARSAEVEKLLKDVDSGFAKLKTGKLNEAEKIMGVPARYWKSWGEVESAKIAGSLKDLPVMVLQGGRDYQVTQEDYNAFQSALRGRPKAAFHSYPDLNHIFQKGKGKAIPSEYLKHGFVDQKVVEDMARWVKSLRG